MTSNIRFLITVLAAVLAALTLSACSLSKFHPRKFEMITVDADNRHDVGVILGEPRFRFEHTWLYDDRDADQLAVVEFGEDGTVTRRYRLDWQDVVSETAVAKATPKRE